MHKLEEARVPLGKGWIGRCVGLAFAIRTDHIGGRNPEGSVWGVLSVSCL